MTNVTVAELAATGTGEGAEMVGFDQIGAGAAARKVSDKFREQFVSIDDYYDPADSGDYALAFGRVIDAGHARIFFPDKAGGYDFSTKVTRTLTRDTVVDFNGQVISGASMIDLRTQAIAGSRTLSANAMRDDVEIEVTNATAIEAGDIISIQSNIAPSSLYDDKKHDTVRAKSKSGSTLHLHQGLSFNWDTSETGLAVYVLRPVRLTLLNPVIHLTQTDGATTEAVGITCSGFVDVLIENPKCVGALPFSRAPASAVGGEDPEGYPEDYENIYRWGIQLWYCIGWRVVNGDYFAVSYPIGVYGGSRNGRELNSKSRYCRHGHADLGGWSTGYWLDGLDDEDSRAAISTHPAFDCHARDFNVRNNIAIPAWRSIGGSLEGSYHTTDNFNASDPVSDPGPMNTGFDYLFAAADYDYRGLKLECPNRTANDMAQQNGRTVYVEGTRAKGFTVGGSVQRVIIGPGNRFGADERPAPRASDFSTLAAVQTSEILDVYEDAGVYHIDPREQLVPQGNGRLHCRGLVYRNVGGQTDVTKTFAIRLHTNAFAELSQSGVTLGRIRLVGTVAHHNTGYFAVQAKEYAFWFGVAAVPSLLSFPTSPLFASTNLTVANHSFAMTLANPTFAGVTQVGSDADHFVQFDVEMLSGNTNPSFSLTYELELVDATL